MFQGAMVALVTPFFRGAVDEDKLRQLIEHQLENRTAAFLACGTTGESPTLSHQEHKRVVEITVEQVAKRVPVWAGAGSNSTAEAIELTRHAKQVGADAALHVTPYYNKPTQEGIFRHFEAITQAVPFPLVPYNIASRTGVNITAPTMARLAGLPEVVAVKEASGDLAQMAHIMELCGDKIRLYSGDDALLLPVLSLGGQGVISVASNVAPRMVAGVTEAWFAGDSELARERFLRMLPLCRAIFLETNPIPIKAAMAMTGLLGSAELRLPLCAMSEGNRKQLQDVLYNLGLL